MENENEQNAEGQEVAQVKTAEQLQSERDLNEAIQDEAQAEAGSGQNQQQSGNRETRLNALYGIISLVPMSCTMFGLKNTAGVWSEGVCLGVSDALLPVLQKYAFGQKFLQYLEKGGGVEEFALLLALAPVAIASYSAFELDTKPLEKEVKSAETNEAQSADSPLGSTFKFGDKK